MRLQIAALPQQPADNVGGWRIPFLVVLDDCAPDFVDQFAELRADFQRDVRDATGAEGLLCFQDRIEIVPPYGDALELGNLDNLDEDVRKLVERGE